MIARSHTRKCGNIWLLRESSDSRWFAVCYSYECLFEIKTLVSNGIMNLQSGIERLLSGQERFGRMPQAGVSALAPSRFRIPEKPCA